MRRMLLAVVLVPCLLTGCIHQAQSSTAPPLPAGAADATDANANRVLQDIQAFVTPFARDIKSGKLQATAGQRDALNTLDGYYNKAVTAEQSYHQCMTVTAAAVTPAAAPPNAVTCLSVAGLSGALADAQGAFTTAQATLAAGARP